MLYSILCYFCLMMVIIIAVSGIEGVFLDISDQLEAQTEEDEKSHRIDPSERSSAAAEVELGQCGDGTWRRWQGRCSSPQTPSIQRPATDIISVRSLRQERRREAADPTSGDGYSTMTTLLKEQRL